MRLNPEQVSVIRESVAREISPAARAWLFGSRIDDAKRGGDIDLLVQLPRYQPDAHKKSLTLAARPQMRVRDQRIDVLIIGPETPHAADPPRSRRHGNPAVSATPLSPVDSVGHA